MQRTSLTAALCVVLLAEPVVALAATDAAKYNYYAPPKLIKRGTNTTAVAGNGTVIVKVLVNKDGSFKVQNVVKSNNPDDNAAALEIARTSSYRPATRGGKAQTAFYDFTLNFTGGNVVSAPVDTTGIAQYERMIRAGNYAGARKELETYVQAHPDDQHAQTDLGVADTYLNDYAAAAGAFDKAGQISDNYKSVAGKAYAEAAVAQIKAKDYKTGLALGKRAVELAPSFSTYNLLGYSEYSAGDFQNAMGDLEKARSLGAASGSAVTAHERGLVDANLVSTYLALGNPDQAQKIAVEAKGLEPSTTSVDNAFVNYYGKLAEDKMTAGKAADAAGLYEQAAQYAPSLAANLYGRAALAYLRVQPKPDNVKAKADADKALALDPSSALGNFAAGISLANGGKNKDALVYLQKADDAAKKAGDTGLATSIESSIKQLSTTK